MLPVNPSTKIPLTALATMTASHTKKRKKKSNSTPKTTLKNITTDWQRPAHLVWTNYDSEED